MKITEFDQYVLKTYNREQVSFTKGQGAFLFDETGNRWLDFISGIGVTNFGHCHPAITKAVQSQLEKLWHTSNIYYIEPQGKAAKLISELAFQGKTFFCNSGAEANEAAIKLARKWGNRQSENKTKIVSLKESFHGRTLAAITLTGQPIYQKNFNPLPADFEYIEANNLAELENAIDENTAALFLEAVQGEGGVVPLSDDFMLKARELTKKYNALLILDEVQTGIGRTGKNFGYQNSPIEPDAITLAKGLGNGIPIGALHIKDFCAVLEPGDHASTFGGNFIATSAAVAVLEELKKPETLKKVKENSALLLEKLNSLQKRFPEIISEMRGKGMMWGIVSPRASELYRALFEEKILSTNIKGKVLRILPPLNIGNKEIEIFIDSLEKALKKIAK